MSEWPLCLSSICVTETVLYCRQAAGTHAEKYHQPCHGAPSGQSFLHSHAGQSAIISHQCMSPLFPPHDCPVAALWPPHGRPMAAPWPPHGCSMAVPWLTHGRPVAAPWLTQHRACFIVTVCAGASCGVSVSPSAHYPWSVSLCSHGYQVRECVSVSPACELAYPRVLPQILRPPTLDSEAPYSR